MRHGKIETVQGDCVATSFVVAAVIAAVVSLSGCSLHTEVGWHGKTGRDDRMYTDMVREAPLDRWGDEKKER